MASSNLMLHCGGKVVTLEELRQLRAPPPEGRWYPVSHGQVRDRVRETLEAAGYQVQKEQLANVLRETELGDVLAESLILRAWDKGIISSPQLPGVLKQWREPEFEEFQDRTAWSLFNAFTRVLTDRFTRNPQAFVAHTMQLHHLLDFKRGETDVPQIQMAT
jgi:hypothetical protein